MFVRRMSQRGGWKGTLHSYYLLYYIGTNLDQTKQVVGPTEAEKLVCGKGQTAPPSSKFGYRAERPLPTKKGMKRSSIRSTYIRCLWAINVSSAVHQKYHQALVFSQVRSTILSFCHGGPIPPQYCKRCHRNTDGQHSNFFPVHKQAIACSFEANGSRNLRQERLNVNGHSLLASHVRVGI